jgi:hypothetical protein
MSNAMLDILDAPVPFLVGLHSRYLSQVPPEKRPRGVVFVDLDKDCVHLGWEDMPNSRPMKRKTPDLPDKRSMKLKTELDACAGWAYLAPATGMKGMITYGNGELLCNTDREPYAQMYVHNEAKGTSTRDLVLSNAEKAYLDNQALDPIVGFFSEEGQLTARVSDRGGSANSPITSPVSSKSKKAIAQMQGLFRRGEAETPTSLDIANNTASISERFYDLPEVSESGVPFAVSFQYGRLSYFCCILHRELQPGDFSAGEVRNAFLRFFTTLFNRYDMYVVEGGAGAPFRSKAFLTDMNLSQSNLDYVSGILETQMFQRFLEDRISNSKTAEILFFDEQILAKQNRSKMVTLAKGYKEKTPFLDDDTWKVRDCSGSRILVTQRPKRLLSMSHTSGEGSFHARCPKQLGSAR